MSDAMHPLLAATPLLDIHHPAIEALVAGRGWRALRPYDRIGAVYEFLNASPSQVFVTTTRPELFHTPGARAAERHDYRLQAGALSALGPRSEGARDAP